MPFEVIIVGAGIGGLCAATALRQAGHFVKIFEKSKFLKEVGAALLLTPNAVRVLSHLGFSFSNAQANEVTRWEVLNGTTLQTLDRTDLHDSQERYGAKIYTVHRSDLHNELIRLALTKREGLKDVELHLGSPVRAADVKAGFVELEDGSRYQADLIIAADGVHSVLKSAVLDQDKASAPSFSGMNAFRFQIPTALLENDAHFIDMLKWKGKGPTVLADTKELKSERHLVWYDCQGGSIQNFVGIHQNNSNDTTAPEVTDWPLYIHDPLPSWNRGKLVLMGDAAHPMLPFGGQGANQAIEDAGALGFLLEGSLKPRNIPSRLALFEKVRRLRASRVQVLSKVRVGKEKAVEQELKRYTDSPDEPVPTSFSDRYNHDFGFDVYQKCADALRQESSKGKWCIFL